MTLRQALLRAVLAVAAVTLVFAGPSFAVRQGTPSKHGNLRDFIRSGGLQKPTAAQRAAVRALHAKATWNNYAASTRCEGFARTPSRSSRRVRATR
jgi:hypothetical protein